MPPEQLFYSQWIFHGSINSMTFVVDKCMKKNHRKSLRWKRKAKEESITGWKYLTFSN